MRAALALAGRGVGRVWPNPAVGCILVQAGKFDRVVGRGWTLPGGRPHAETEALARAGDQARGATAYVTLEPCAHTGETAPCADALIDAGVSRVVVAQEDPDPRVAGGGIERMRKAGIAVDVGCEMASARLVNAGFLSRIECGRPWVALKAATTLDGKIATPSGHSKWITGPEARARGHLLRARFDAILTGTGTANADNPRLTCRLAGLQNRSPVPVVMVGKTRLDPASHLASSGYTRVYGDGTRPEPKTVLADLASTGITRVLIEAGPGIAAAFLERDLIDEIHWFRAPTVMGGDGLAAIGELGHDNADLLRAFDLAEHYTVGIDSYDILRRREPNMAHTGD
ncbi:MAG: bifunctional diaminohydroxyphosphoribosylaminopyrimidine deaminase/5-amino-6-(5-phosphoribosylamino)uracil reductase RibD [Rhodospirillaceae bacterium]|nr:bifunctional diaminohydroxyphosphoribosylaminopyrimidine deaminase/5-amino-6-(5-phosphoribosylamino)uracil reductase RibD [Rhodospirillaceae bacterium]